MQVFARMGIIWYHSFGIIETHCIELQLRQYAQVLRSGTGRVQGASIVTWKRQQVTSHKQIQDEEGIKQALAFNLHKRLAIDRRISYSIQQSSNI